VRDTKKGEGEIPRFVHMLLLLLSLYRVRVYVCCCCAKNCTRDFCCSQELRAVTILTNVNAAPVPGSCTVHDVRLDSWAIHGAIEKRFFAVLDALRR
jgi:hypothetical protein